MTTSTTTTRPTYLVTRTFIGGLLDGLTHTETTTVEYEVGFVCKRPAGGSPYRIDGVERVED